MQKIKTFLNSVVTVIHKNKRYVAGNSEMVARP